MTKVAPLSYKSQYGYYGLRVNPSFAEVAGTVSNDLRIPVPDRSARWYALSPYRALILDAQKKYHDYERMSLDYKDSGAALPEMAATVTHSAAENDPTFHQYDLQYHASEVQDAHILAHSAMQEGHRRETAEIRRQQLQAHYHPNLTNPTIEANHDELEEAGVHHHMPAPGMAPMASGWRTPAEQFAAGGQPQAAEFPTFESLNMGQPKNIRAANLSYSQRMTYERMREFVAEPTWST